MRLFNPKSSEQCSTQKKIHMYRHRRLSLPKVSSQLTLGSFNNVLRSNSHQLPFVVTTITDGKVKRKPLIVHQEDSMPDCDVMQL